MNKNAYAIPLLWKQLTIPKKQTIKGEVNLLKNIQLTNKDIYAKLVRVAMTS